MNEPVTALAQSDSKASFCRRLGLNIDDPDHRRIYLAMKVSADNTLYEVHLTWQAEALKARQEMTAGRSALSPDLQRDPAVQPPFSISQISETAMHRAMQDIYTKASPQTRGYYERAWIITGSAPENWIIRWMLWHVFRYRDKRNKHARTYPQNLFVGEHSQSSPEQSSPVRWQTKAADTLPIITIAASSRKPSQ